MGGFLFFPESTVKASRIQILRILESLVDFKLNFIICSESLKILFKKALSCTTVGFQVESTKVHQRHKIYSVGYFFGEKPDEILSKTVEKSHFQNKKFGQNFKFLAHSAFIFQGFNQKSIVFLQFLLFFQKIWPKECHRTHRIREYYSSSLIASFTMGQNHNF